MSDSGVAASIEPFFLQLPRGDRFCILHRPPSKSALLGGVVYVHPFAEELNKSRRMASMMSRRLAECGFAVLQMDLFGCGDSYGEIRDATVSQWRSDIQSAADWLLERELGPLTVWGLRFGALLALDWSRRTATPHRRVVLWQPVVSGETHLTQFLRIGVAADMLGSTGGSAGGGARKQLAQGNSVEVAGYDITPDLQREMDTTKITTAMAAGPALEWFELLTPPAQDMVAGNRRVVDALRAEGARLRTHLVEGEPFWSTVEIVDCPALIDSTGALLSGCNS